jgi:phosphatidylinositol alpha-1,6-mannosyltransferase
VTDSSGILVLTPGVAGADGISAVARQVVRALADDTTTIEVWSLDGVGGAGGGLPGAIRSADGSRSRYVFWSLEAAASGAGGRLVLALHLQLAPVALPLVARGARLAIFLHGVEAWRPVTGLQRAALARAVFVLANSHYTVKRFKEANPAFADSDVTVCPLGLPPVAPAMVRGGRDSGAPFALIVGRMAAEERYKGHDVLIEIWPRVLANHPTATLAIAGDGDDRPRLERMALERGLGDRVRFLGPVPDEELTALYARCACFVLPSHGEGFGLVFLEAMRAGRPCIGAAGAAAEVIEDGVTGLLVDPDRPGTLVEALERLLEDVALGERMGRAGAARFHREFTDAHFRGRLRAALGRPALERVVIPC